MKKADDKNVSRNCSRIMEKYLSLDKNQKVPLEVSSHLLKCRKCRKQVRALRIAERVSAESFSFEAPLEDNLIQSVLTQIDPKTAKKMNYQEKIFGLWTTSGIVLIFAFVLVVFAAKNFQNRDLLMAIATVIAGFVTVWGVLYIATNVDFFIKRINSSLRT